MFQGTERIAQAKLKAEDAVEAKALARRRLHQVRSDRTSTSEDNFEAAMAFRNSEAALDEAVEEWVSAVMATQDEA